MCDNTQARLAAASRPELTKVGHDELTKVVGGSDDVTGSIAWDYEIDPTSIVGMWGKKKTAPKKKATR